METSLLQIRQRESFGFSAENPTGTREGGTHAKDCEKLRPCIDIEKRLFYAIPTDRV